MRPQALLVLATLALGEAGCAAATPAPVTVVEVAPPRPASSPPPVAPPPAEPEGLSEDELVAVMQQLEAVRAIRRVEGAGFHHEVPSEWEDLDPATLGSPLIRCSQRNTQALDGFMTNVNVASEPFAGDGPAYADANLLELRKVSTIRDQRAARAGDRPASDIEAWWPNPGGVPYVTLQRYATDDHEGFVITCSAAASSFERERPQCMRILDSFRVE